MPNNREPSKPENYFRIYSFIENTGIDVDFKFQRILPAFATITDTEH